MKRRLSGPSLLLLLLLLCTPAPGLGSVLERHFFYNQNHFTWRDAQSFCRRYSYNTDLAIVYTQSDADSMDLDRCHAWIGLHRPVVSSSSWSWSDGQGTDFRPWASQEPDDTDDCASISSRSKNFYGRTCEGRSFAICQSQKSQYTFVPESKTWPEARQYCRAQYQDLATFKSHSEVQRGVLLQDFPVWTGLHRDAAAWKWSSGRSDYRGWAPGEPSGSGDCVAVSSLGRRLSTQNCSARFPLVCSQDNLVLVRENKTWEEALQHCRALASPHFYVPRHELLSVQPGQEQEHARNRVMEADTEEVWTGLRFLAGDWLWVNAARLLHTDLPNCPPARRHCGALSKSDRGRLETRDCAERKNFLCYSWW